MTNCGTKLLALTFLTSLLVLDGCKGKSSQPQVKVIAMPTSEQELVDILSGRKWYTNKIESAELLLWQFIMEDGQVVTLDKEDDAFRDLEATSNAMMDSAIHSSFAAGDYVSYSKDLSVDAYSFDVDFGFTTLTKSRYQTGAEDGVFYWKKDTTYDFKVYESATMKDITAEYKRQNPQRYFDKTLLEKIETIGGKNYLTTLVSVGKAAPENLREKKVKQMILTFRCREVIE